nr:MAG: putative capsid protein [Cressdnaviricota sp.]
MAYARRSYRRYRRRSFRRRRPTRARYTRRYRRRYRSYKSTKSSVVKLSFQGAYTPYNDSDREFPWVPYRFKMSNVTGFSDYLNTYTHFRVLKARMYIGRDLDGENNTVDTNYLIVGSRPFAATQLPLPGAVQNPDLYVPGQSENALRQAKWQKNIYPRSTTSRISVGFHPYTMIATFGPTDGNDGKTWQRIWEGRYWMPMTWANNVYGLNFWGPYIAHFQNLDSEPVEKTYNYTLELQLQFKGQK